MEYENAARRLAEALFVAPNVTAMLDTIALHALAGSLDAGDPVADEIAGQLTEAQLAAAAGVIASIKAGGEN